MTMPAQTAHDVRSSDPSAGGRTASWAIGTIFTIFTIITAVALLPDLRHWYTVPVTICGILISADVVDWARRRLDIFDPQAILGLLGAHFFFIAPLLHVTLDYWPKYVAPSTDWKNALGQMAILNVFGLLLYRLVVSRSDRPAEKPLVRTDLVRLRSLGRLVIVVSLLAYALFITSFGGPAAFIAAISSTDRDLAGYGPLQLAAGTFPLIAFALLLVGRRDFLRRHPSVMFLALAAFTTMSLLTVGLGGSRSATIWPFLSGMAMCHLIVTRIKRRVLVISLVAAGVFMYVYGFYKNVGADALKILTGETTTAYLTRETGRDLPGLLLGDLGRSDIQALTLERHDIRGIEPGYGLTYLGDATFLLPSSLEPPGVPDKVELGTDILLGPGAFDSNLRSSNIYGLAGEGILNFGRPGAVLVFIPLGFFVRYARRRYRAARSHDGSIAAKLLAPNLPVIAILALGSDLDNVLWFAVNHVLVLAALLLATRRPLSTQQ